MDSSFKDAVSERLLERLTGGESLKKICRDDDMPSRETVRLWSAADPDFALAIMRAREEGYHDRAEQAVADAKSATDAGLGRLAFEAERWYLGKLSNAFSDKVKLVGGDPGDPPIAMESTLNVKDLTAEQLRALASIPVQTG